MTSAAWRARLIVLACVLDLVNSGVFLVIGVSFFTLASRGFSQTGEPAQYGAGMLIGGIGLIATVGAIVCLVHGYWCWRSLRRSDTRGAGWLRTLLVLIVPAGATVISVWLAQRLIG